jgi:hypothetical protein
MVLNLIFPSALYLRPILYIFLIEGEVTTYGPLMASNLYEWSH